MEGGGYGGTLWYFSTRVVSQYVMDSSSARLEHRSYGQTG